MPFPAPAITAEARPDTSEFAIFAHAIRRQRLRSQKIVRRALNRLRARMRIRAVAESGASSPTVLYRNFTEETDEDLF